MWNWFEVHQPVNMVARPLPSVPGQEKRSLQVMPRAKEYCPDG